MNASIHLRTNALQGVPGASAVVRGKVAAGSVAPAAASLASRAEKVAAVAAEHAAAVDRDSRFPAEAMAAARAECLMGIAVPRELGGEGASIGDVVDVCYQLGQACASTAMIYAMHQTKIACIVRHVGGERLARAAPAPPRRRAAAARLLDHRRPGRRQRALERGADRARTASASRLSARRPSSPTATTADGVVTTARRAPDAAASDQVLVVLLKSDYTLDELQRLERARHARHLQRGLHARRLGRPPSRSCPRRTRPSTRDHGARRAPFVGRCLDRHRREAVERAHAFVRKAMQSRGGQLPPGAPHFTRADVLAAHPARPARRLAAQLRTGDGRPAALLESVDFQTGITLTQGRGLGAGRRDRHERHARLRSCPATATTASSVSAATCATSCPRRS